MIIINNNKYNNNNNNNNKKKIKKNTIIIITETYSKDCFSDTTILGKFSLILAVLVLSLLEIACASISNF